MESKSITIAEWIKNYNELRVQAYNIEEDRLFNAEKHLIQGGSWAPPFPLEFRIMQNLIDLEKNKKIYRIISFEEFIDILSTKTMSLSRPSAWDDKWENMFFRLQYKGKDNDQISVNMEGDRYYAQCWSLRRECDGLWRSFGRSGVSVKVQTTAEKLLKEIFRESEQMADTKYFLGKVKYFSEKKIDEYINSLKDDFYLGIDSGVPSLLMKRSPFNYEREVRLIYYHMATNSDQRKLTERQLFEINPNHLYESVTFSPFLRKDLYKSLKETIIKLGYTNSIFRSSLYDKVEDRISKTIQLGI
jgi:hypothetical protein